MNLQESATVQPSRREHQVDHPIPARFEPSGPKIVAIGGGTGLPVVLRGLVRACADAGRPDRLTAIAAVTDDEGSSGMLRRQLDILPPGDVRNCLVALAGDESRLTSLLQHRFKGHTPLAGHTIGNLMLAALVQQTGGFLSAIQRMGEILSIHGRVLPATESNVHLRAELGSGEIIDGVSNIVSARSTIRRIGFDRPVRPMPEAIRALVNSDIIVVGPGSLYTSILPNLLVTGIAPTIGGLNAIRIYVANLMTEPGETDGYTLEDHLGAIIEHTKAQLFDYVLVNKAPMSAAALADYAGRGSVPVVHRSAARRVDGAIVVERDLLSEADGLVRHSPEALAAAIMDIWEAGRHDCRGFSNERQCPKAS
jgi:uncharacterized cofD-like protein